ncbi:MAG: hypothetical protein KF721_01510 [Ignavibacteriaceae bacterium]|nr:hypothetical protein [Ignavibacteriaceae bacterium]HRI46425.1 hypothetical protein [Ignavibacteriaceae bacterium]
MLLSLLAVTFAIAFITSLIITMVFKKSLNSILLRIINDEISSAWSNYIIFAIFVVGISGGVRIWQLEKYITPQTKDSPILVLNQERWILEIFRTIIETLQSIAWMLLLFFVFALIAFVIVRISELKRQKQN